MTEEARYLEFVEASLRKDRRAATSIGVVFLGAFSLGTIAIATQGRTAAEMTLGLVLFTLLAGLPGLLLVRRGGRAGADHPLLTALRTEPARIRSIALQYEQGMTGYRASVVVALENGTSHTLPPPRGEEQRFASWLEQRRRGQL